MLRFLLIPIFFTTAVNVNAASLRYKKPSGRIIGGEDAVIETYPYQVSIRYSDIHFCGGSIISNNWVLTAGHCIGDDFDDLTVRAGGTWIFNVDDEPESTIHHADNVILHEKYEIRDDGVPIFDIALVHVKEPFISDDKRQPIDMFKLNETSRTGSWAVITGWGQTIDPIYHGQLQSVAVPLINLKLCREAYKNDIDYEIPDGQICAGYYEEGGKDACQGDSGGPMAINGRLAGIVSWGNGCADAYYPGVYTEIAYFRNWIKIHSGL